MLEQKKITPQILKKLKNEGEKVTLLTAYDYPFALIEDEAGIDIILVGDSIAMTKLGMKNTLSVGMTELLIACKAVASAVKRAMVIADMPYMSYQPSNALAIKNAGKFISVGADGVKIEGGKSMLPRIKAIINAGIPVMGHIGFTPQSLKKFGTYKVLGKTQEEIKLLVEDAIALEKTGVFCIIIECVTSSVVQEIKKHISIPIYGIGAGKDCDGQILVIYDMLGLYPGFLPKYVKKYANIKEIITSAIKKYISEVKSGEYPDQSHLYE